MIIELKIILQDVSVPVSRVVQIEADQTFNDLHECIQVAFGWSNDQMYQFHVTETYANSIKIAPKNSTVPTVASIDHATVYRESNQTIADWFTNVDDLLFYTYDFDNEWKHQIILQDVLEKERNTMYPKCTKAENFSPAEKSRDELMTSDLSNNDDVQLIKEINNKLKSNIHGTKSEPNNCTVDYWPATLQQAKEYHMIKPWNLMSDEQIFAIFDPESENYLFCSVIGRAGDMFGLTVYFGMEGLFSLIDILTNARTEFDILQRQHSLLVSFENRNDIDAEEYNLIKKYDTTFRGEKAWPSFISFVPGYFPWTMNNEEARVMLLALKETIAIYKEIEKGLELPDLLEDEELIVRTAQQGNEGQFQSIVTDLDDILATDKNIELTISELELKRVSKIKRPLPVTIEFMLTYVNIPIESEENKRPIFPLTVIVADHDEDIVLHHELYEQTLSPSIVQREFINLFHNLNGIPQMILTDERTYYYIGSLLDELNVNVEIVEELPVVDHLLEGLQGYLESK